MIAILKEEDIDLIVKSYMYSDNTNYILRLIKVFSKESERYCLFSFDYMSDQAKNYSLALAVNTVYKVLCFTY